MELSLFVELKITETITKISLDQNLNDLQNILQLKSYLSLETFLHLVISQKEVLIA